MNLITKDELLTYTDEIMELRKEGQYIKDIAKKYNASVSMVQRLVLANGGRIRKELTEADKKEICRLYTEEKVSIDHIGDRYHKGPDAIKDVLKELGIQILSMPERKQKYRINQNYFDNIDTPEKAYVLGLMITDGCIYHNSMLISLQEDDRHILEDIKKLMESEHPLRYTPSSTRDGYICKPKYTLCIVNKHNAENWKKHGVVENKTHIAEYPKWLPNELFPAFMRGVVDGDGSIIKTRDRVSIVGTQMLLEGIQNKLIDFNIDSKILGCKNHPITRLMYIDRKDNVKKFLDLIYKNSTIHLKRKYDRYCEKYLIS